MQGADEAQKKPSRYKTQNTLWSQIFASDTPKALVRALPAQAIYHELKRDGLHSHPELLELASDDQCRILTDLDFWNGHEFNEESFWEWLELPDSAGDLKPLSRLLRFVDLKLVALLLSRYVNVHYSDEPTDAPPAPDYFSPDKGRTWIQLAVENQHHQFLLGRLLAFIFESDAKVFYQLLHIPSVSTDSVLEEQGFSDKERRLSAEGIPDEEVSIRMNSPLPEALILRMLKEKSLEPASADCHAIAPLLDQKGVPEPLASLIRELKDPERSLGELSRLMNGAIVRWGIPFYDADAVERVTLATRGTINVGLARILERTEKAHSAEEIYAEEIYQHVGFEGLYRFGLSLTLPFRNLAREIDAAENDKEESSITDPLLLAIIAAATKDLPHLPLYVDEIRAGHALPEKLSGEFKPIEQLDELRWAIELLKSTTLQS